MRGLVRSASPIDLGRKFESSVASMSFADRNLDGVAVNIWRRDGLGMQWWLWVKRVKTFACSKGVLCGNIDNDVGRVSSKRPEASCSVLDKKATDSRELPA